jgi:hypothetical protein
MARKRERDEGGGAAATPAKKGGAGLLFALLGCGGLSVCLCCLGGGGIGWYAYTRVSEAVVATKPIGSFPIADLDKETAIWSYSIRPPKGMTFTEKEKNVGGPDETSVCMITGPGESQIMVNKSKFRADPKTGATGPLAIMVAQSPAYKSAPGGAVKYDTPHNPQAIEMNGIPGARTWKLIEHRPDHFETKLYYRYHVDGWVVIFIGAATGKSRNEALKNAEPIDAALCTFKKR